MQAQCVHLRCQYCHVQISGIGSITTCSGLCRLVNVKVSPRTRHGKVMAVEAVVLLLVTTNVPSTSVPIDNNWKHLSNLQLTDPDFGTSRNIDLILGATVFSRAILHRRWLRPQDHPSCSRRLSDGSWLVHVPFTNALASAPSSRCADDQQPSNGL